MSEYSHSAHELAEGTAREGLRERSTIEHGISSDLPLFYRYVVLETIFDPHIIDQTKLDYWERDLSVANIKHAVVAPRNSIIAKRIITNDATHSENTMILYPFMPPNISLPCNPGEHVWVMFEDRTGTKNDLGYWMWRIVGPHHAEDVNHSHPHRAFDPSFSPGIREQFDGNDEPTYEIKNGVAGISNGERFTRAETATIPDGDEDAYKKLMMDTDGGKLSVYESVPRYRKRPGDVALEGSNNTLIVLGRDRSGPIAQYEFNEAMGITPVPPDHPALSGMGSIDLVVGRGQQERTGGISVENDIPVSEIAKSKSQVVDDEGDPDFSSDRSRVLISQRTQIDSNFSISGFNSQFSGGSISGDDEVRNVSDSETGDGGIAIKSDKVRIIARSDVEFIVTGFTRSENGRMTANADDGRWAAIVIKANGDIVFKPADHGYIKLGSDLADKGLLCTDMPAPAANGRVDPVASPPILTTMGGQIATGNPGQGMLASKILVVGDK